MVTFAKKNMITRYFIFISFKGSYYHGWQIQPHSVTVQDIVDCSLSTITGEKIVTTGAGRTDSGVHAKLFCAHFDSARPDLAARKEFIGRLNRYLPEDIAVTDIRKVDGDANARFSALSRTYRYYISRVKDPFMTDYSWQLQGDIDMNAMNDACSVLMKHNDFTSFSRLHSNARTNLCRIFDARWEAEGNMLVFTIKADRFLRNMVRAVVGTMIMTGTGKIDLADFEEIIMAKNRCKAGKSAPARGLFLAGIEYPDGIFIQ